MWYLIGAVVLALFVLGYRKSRARSAVVCPRCSKRNEAAAMVCRNCGRTGLEAKVITVHSVKSVFWNCKACKTSATEMRCECGTDLFALFRQ